MSRGTETLIVNKQFREELEEETAASIHKKRPWTKGIYDVEKKVYCGRTSKAWAQLLLAYFILYALLTVWVAMFFQVFYGNLSKDIPRWIAHQPTFSITPCSDEATRFCHYERFTKDVKPLIKTNLVMLRKYGDPEKLEQYKTCTRVDSYGYKNDEPCFFLKVNRVIGFSADVYERGAELPDYAPKELKEHIDSLEIWERLNRIWISCEADAKATNISYYPERGVNASLLNLIQKFEKNPDDYKDKDKVEQFKELGEERKFYNDTDFGRIIAVQFSNLPTNKIIRVDCFMWAKNIVITKDPTHGAGKVSIRLQINEDDDD